MPQVEISLPDDVEMQIDQLVEQGDFVDRDAALEELLSIGLKEHRVTIDDDPADEMGFADEMMETNERSLGGEDDGYQF